MGFWRFARHAVGAGLAGLLLTACSEPLSGTQRALPPDASQARAQRASRSSGELVYAITAKGIVVFSYPKWSIVARISGSGIWFSVCSDPNTGNVFAVAGTPAQCRTRLEEYLAVGLDQFIIEVSGNAEERKLALDLVREVARRQAST